MSSVPPVSREPVSEGVAAGKPVLHGPASGLPVTVVIPTLNEADRIAACLQSVSWAADRCVVDGGSTDDTVAIATRLGARVITGHFRTISEQRNAAIASAVHPWVLALDADERATSALEAAIASVLTAPPSDVAAYRIRMQNRYLGAPMERGSWGRDWHVRFFRSTLRFEVKRVHEGLQYAGEVGTLTGTIAHDSYRDLYHHLTKVGTYARWGAEDLQQKGRVVSMSDLVVRPLWRFIRAYLMDGNWRDGRRGLIFSVVHAWSAFAKYALLWDRERLAAEARSASPVTNAGATPSAPVPAATGRDR